MSNAHHIPTTPACLPRPRPESPHNAGLISTLPDSTLLPSCKGQDARHAVSALPSLFCPHPHVSLHAKHLPSLHIPSPASPAPVPHLNKLPSTLGNSPSLLQEAFLVHRRNILPAVCTAPWHPPKLPGSLDSPPPAGPPGSAGSTAAGPPHLPMRQGKKLWAKMGPDKALGHPSSFSALPPAHPVLLSTLF